MKTARFWTGLLILTSPLMGIVIARAADLLHPPASVEGRITYQGRPLHGGSICLISQDRERSSDMIGRIDQDGHFSCRPEWWQAQDSRTSFEIRLYPDPRHSSEHETVFESNHASPNDEDTSSTPLRATGSGGAPRIVLASMSTAVPDRTDAQAVRGQTPAAVGPSVIEVAIGSEPVHLDINLGD